MTKCQIRKMNENYKKILPECWRKFDSTRPRVQCQVLCEWSTDWPHDISLGPAESNRKNAGRVVTDGVMRMWSLKLPVDLRACAVCDHWGIFEHHFEEKSIKKRSQTWCQVLFFTSRAPYLPWVPCPAGGWNFVHGYPLFLLLGWLVGGLTAANPKFYL